MSNRYVPIPYNSTLCAARELFPTQLRVLPYSLAHRLSLLVHPFFALLSLLFAHQFLALFSLAHLVPPPHHVTPLFLPHHSPHVCFLFLFGLSAVLNTCQYASPTHVLLKICLLSSHLQFKFNLLIYLSFVTAFANYVLSCYAFDPFYINLTILPMHSSFPMLSAVSQHPFPLANMDRTHQISQIATLAHDDF